MNNKSLLTDDKLQVEYWPIDKVIPYERNVKVHSDKQVKALAKIIKKDGFRVPIIVDENGVIIAGHGRRLAMIKLKSKVIPVMVLKGMSEERKDAMRISDNKIASNEYDIDLLGEEVMRLSGLANFDLDSLGMDGDELNGIFEKFAIGDLSEDLPDSYTDSMPKEIDTTPKTVKEVEYKPSWHVVVECSGEQEQAEIYEMLKRQGRNCKIQTM